MVKHTDMVFSKQFTIFLLSSILTFFTVYGQNYQLDSPSKNISLQIQIDKVTSFSLFFHDELIMKDVTLAMNLHNQTIPDANPRIKSIKKESIHEIVESVIPTKSRFINNHYNQLVVKFNKNYSLEFRAFNNGIAYRFLTHFNDSILINDETISFSFPDDPMVWFPEENSMISHYERMYKKSPASEIETEKFCSLPVLFKNKQGINILLTEADLVDYPGMFLQKDSMYFNGIHPRVILEMQAASKGPDRNIEILKEANFIAQTTGKRSFPWRLMMVEPSDEGLLTNDLVFLLSRPPAADNATWIRPGKVAWDWWNANNIYGVDFSSGINTETYRYYIDFAAEFGLEYIILDEGWSVSTTNIVEYKPEVNIPELVQYARLRNVGIILWALWGPLDQNMEAILDLYQNWGIAGIKVDFMQRADQGMVNFYEKTVKESAKRKLLVDFHGAYKPSGLRRAYPNLLSYEGVKGLENSKWSNLITPAHDLTIPFIRMAAGPMDYTPGAMSNAHKNNFIPRWNRPMSQGTRTHQVAMYVVYESPLQMLCDNPSSYLKERETTQFIAQIPTIWDTTIVLHASIGENLLIARKNNDCWYIGGLNADDPY